MKFNRDQPYIHSWKGTGNSIASDPNGDPPIENDETYDVEIEKLGWDGDGIARISGYVVFVPGTEVGDRVKIRINNLKSNFAFADVVKFII